MVPDKRDPSEYLESARSRVVTNHQHVFQYKERIFPSEERTARSNDIPTNHASVRQELERIKAEKAARRAQREQEATGNPDANEAVKRLV